MSIADQIQNYNDGLLSAYNAVSSKGGTVPAQKNLVNLATAITSIPAGQTGPTDSNTHITGYNNTTKVVTGDNFGSTQGTVWVLDRDTHSYNQVAVSSWSDTSITLQNSFNLATLVGTTCFFVRTATGANSTKWMLYGSVAVPGYGLVYYKEFGTDEIKKIQMASTSDYAKLQGANNVFGSEVTINNVTIWKAQIVGVQFANQTYSVPTIFLGHLLSLNQPVVLPAKFTLGTSSTYLMRYDGSFDCPIVFECTTKRAYNYFLDGCTSFNQPLSLSGMTQVGTYFMRNCTSFNQKIDFTGCTTTSIGNYFMNSCYSFNQDLKFPNTVTSIGSYFMQYCYSFNGDIDFGTSLKTITTYFMSLCRAFNKPLNFPNTGTSISNYFLNGCSAFNSPIKFSTAMTTIGTYFMQNCTAFNQPLNFVGGTFTALPNYFLYNCNSFNSPITFSKTITSVGDSVLNGCNAFDKPIPWFSTVTTVGNSFMYMCQSFNQPIDMSSLISVGNQFLCYCNALQQNLVFPASMTSFGTDLLGYVQNLERITVNCSAHPTDVNSLAARGNLYFPYVHGITLFGTYASTWKEALPDSTTSYRKLIDGTA